MFKNPFEKLSQKYYRLYSWKKVFWADVEKKLPSNILELKSIIEKGNFYTVGKSHSYNGIQTVEKSKSIFFEKLEFDKVSYDKQTHQVTVGPAVTIEKLKRELIPLGRRLVNSGNYMAQTVIGALVTGTHGYGPKAVMADSICELKFLDFQGNEHKLKKSDPDFEYVALSFGLIAPIISATLQTEELESFQSDVFVCQLSEKDEKTVGAKYISYAVLPYSDLINPTIVIHTLRPNPGKNETSKNYHFLSLKWFAHTILTWLWAIDRIAPFIRPKVQKIVGEMALDIHQIKYTDKQDMDYLYDPDPMLASERTPHILRGIFSTTHTAYNLAFFVERDIATEVIKFIINEAENLRFTGFHLKSTIGVRELDGKSNLAFAGNFNGPVSAIDIFSDPRDYAWLERIQSEVLQYFSGKVRPHWGKSAIVNEFKDALGQKHIDYMRQLHIKHFPHKSLMLNPQISRLFGFPTPAPGTQNEKESLTKRGLN